MDFPRLLIVILTSAIIFILSIDLIRRKGSPNPDSPSSFFALDQLVSKPAFSVICLFFSGVVSVLYAAIALDSGNVLSATQKLLLEYIKNTANNELKPALETLFGSVPSWLEPLFVFLVFLFLFGDRVQTWLTRLRDSFVRASGLYSLIDTAALATADAVLRSNPDYESAVSQLEKLKGECPVPEEFVGQKDKRRLAYQIIWSVRDSISEDGFTESNSALRTALGLSAKPHSRTQFARVAVAATIYGVLMALFIVFCPLLEEYARQHGLYWTDFFGCLRQTLKFTLAFTLPLLLAVSVYPLRRRAYHAAETPFQSIATVAAMQFATSFVSQELFNLIEASIPASAGSASTLFEPKTHVLAFLYSLTPILAFLAILLSRATKRHALLSAFVICMLSAVAFGVSDLVFELYNRQIDYFFVHQFIFGFWITFSFLVYGLIMRPRRGPVRPGVPTLVGIDILAPEPLKKAG